MSLYHFISVLQMSLNDGEINFKKEVIHEKNSSIEKESKGDITTQILRKTRMEGLQKTETGVQRLTKSTTDQNRIDWTLPLRLSRSLSRL